MFEAKESDPKCCCDSQSEKRQRDYQEALRSDRTKVVFDDKLLQLLTEYARNPELVEEVRNYLNQVTDESGVMFGRSIKQYASLMAIVKKFLLPEAKPFTWNRNFRRAVERVIARYSKAHLRVKEYLSNEDILDTISDLDTSAGYTYITDGCRHKGDFPRGKLLERLKHEVDRALRDGTFGLPILLFWRTQCSGEYTIEGEETDTCKHKTRPVWAVAMWVVICELMWAKPLNEWLKNYSYSAIGKNDDYIGRWVTNARSRNSRWFSVDYSSYDATIPSWLIHTAFDVLAAAFEMSEQEEKLLRVLEHDFIHKDAVTADGLIHVDHGNPSGSGFTAIINGICNEIITETWREALYPDTQIEYEIMGDDNLIFFSGEQVSFEAVASYIQYNFGIQANADKDAEGRSNQDPRFLSREWTFAGAYRHPKILISRMLFPERWRDYSKIDPALVFYSYYLGYRAGIEQAFDVERFLEDYPDLNRNKVVQSKVAFKQLPFNVQLAWSA